MNIELNSWHHNCFRQDSDFCTDRGPDYDELMLGLETFYDEVEDNEWTTRQIIDELGGEENLIAAFLFWPNKVKECLTYNGSRAYTILRQVWEAFTYDKVIVPLRMYDHSACIFYSGDRKTDRWDTSLVGFVVLHHDGTLSEKEAERYIDEYLEDFTDEYNGWYDEQYDEQYEEEEGTV